MAILQKNKKSHLERNMFFDNGVDIARYDQVKYPQLEKITDKQLGFFWRPEEVDVSKDKKDFNEYLGFNLCFASKVLTKTCCTISDAISWFEDKLIA